MVGEQRDPARKEATFFCVNRESGQILWQGAVFVDPWWTGIEAVHRDMVFFHGFATPQMPQHLGITAVDLFTGKKLWERPDLRFAGAGGDRVLGAEGDPSGEHFCLVDRVTGRTEAPAGPREASAFTDESAQLEEQPRFPGPAEAAAAEDPPSGALVQARLVGVHVAGRVGVLNFKKRLVFSYHDHVNFPDEQKPLYDHVLLVADRAQGRIVFSAVLDTGIGSLVPEPFFVHLDTLYCIRERRTLLAVPLGDHHDTTAS
jgi:hypothetical protein